VIQGAQGWQPFGAPVSAKERYSPITFTAQKYVFYPNAGKRAVAKLTVYVRGLKPNGQNLFVVMNCPARGTTNSTSPSIRSSSTRASLT